MNNDIKENLEIPYFKISYSRALYYTVVLLFLGLPSLSIVEFLGLQSVLVFWKIPIVQFVWFLLAIAFVLQIHKNRKEVLQINFHQNKSFFTYFYAFLFFVCSILFAELVVNFIPKDGFFKEHFELFSNATKNQFNNFVPGLISAILLAPVLEEFFFRGLLLQGLLNNLYKPKSAIVFSALLFSSMHFFVWPVAYSFMIGISLGMIYFFTRTLFFVIGLHALNNAISAYYFIENKSNYKEYLLTSDVEIFHYIAVAFLPIFAFLMYKSSTKNQ